MTIWKPCPGFEGVYEISESASIRRILGGSGRVTGRALRWVEDRDGYPRYVLTHKGKRKTVRGHRLVCEAFHGPPPPGLPWDLHRDGNPRNNHYTNLYWGSPKQNQADSITHRTHVKFKTHCKHGHEFTEETTYLHRGERKCRPCRSTAAQRHREKVRSEGIPVDRHGLIASYGFGCRCGPCKDARRAYMEQRRSSIDQ